MKSQNLKLFMIGIACALGLSALASIPRHSTDPVAIREDVSEIRVKRHQELSADQDLKRLSALQGRYRENLPLRKRAVARRSDSLKTSRAAPARKVAPVRAKKLRR